MLFVPQQTTSELMSSFTTFVQNVGKGSSTTASQSVLSAEHSAPTSKLGYGNVAFHMIHNFLAQPKMGEKITTEWYDII
jgi:hypothetical protein